MPSALVRTRDVLYSGVEVFRERSESPKIDFDYNPDAPSMSTAVLRNRFMMLSIDGKVFIRMLCWMLTP